MTAFTSITKWLRRQKHEHRRRSLEIRCAHLASQIKEALSICADPIPVFVISYNNGVYVRNSVRQLRTFGITPIIIDNCSSDVATHSILNEIKRSRDAYLAFSNNNFGHRVGFMAPIYDFLPEIFAYTDPDLQLNANLPRDFLNQLAALTATYKVFKAGFALPTDGQGEIRDKKLKTHSWRPIFYEREWSIADYESRFWRLRLRNEQLEVYAAPIDTTFAVYKKSNYLGDFHDAVRVAGDYSAIHLPWFSDLDLFSEDEREDYRRGNISTNWV